MKSIYLFVLLSPFLLNAQKGHYYDLEDNRIDGNFKVKGNYLGAGSSIQFYEANGNKKKLRPNMVKSFVLGLDSFAVIKNFSAGGVSYFNLDFAKVLDTGTINIYLHKSKVIRSRGVGLDTYSSFETREVFVLNKKGTNQYHGIYNKIRFKNIFIPMIKENSELIEEIMGTKKRFWLDYLDSFVKEYNQSVLNSQ